MKGKEWLIVVVVVIVVAVLASLITSNLTGNVIKVPDSTKTNDVYTKTEVDSALSQLNSQIRYGTGSITYDMLIRLDKCAVIKDKQANGVVSCDTICKNNGNNTMICVDADYQGTLRPCSDSAGSINTDRFCKCCGL